MMTSEFEMISNELNQCKWYLLPLKVQELFPITIANAQQSTFIQGYGNIICTRETFQIVSLIHVNTVEIILHASESIGNFAIFFIPETRQ